MMENNLSLMINELRIVLRGRSNMIFKDEIEKIIKKYEDKLNIKPLFNIDIKDDSIGFIPQFIKKYQWKKQFSEKELNELKKIKHDAYLKKLKEIAEKEGERLAERDDGFI